MPPSETGLEDAVLVGNIALGMLGHLTETVRNFDRVDSAGRGRGEAIGVDEAPRGTEEHDEVTFDQARIQMVAGTIAALRTELNRLERSDDAARNAVNRAFNRRDRNGRGRGRGRARVQLRPMVISGTLTPQAWDLDGMDGMDGDGERNGLGWNDMFSEVDEDLGDREVDVMERLEVIVSFAYSLTSLVCSSYRKAGQMLTSLQDLNTSRTDLSRGNTPPPLEPISAPEDPDEHEDGRRGETWPTPLAWLGFQVQDRGSTNDADADEGDDDLPSLQSISSSSSGEDGHAGEVQARSDRSVATFEHGVDGREERSQWPLSRLLSGGIQTSETSAGASASRISGETSAPPAASSSSRFSTVVDREETRMIIDIDDDDDDENERNIEDTLEDEVKSEDDVDSELIIPLRATLLEPPFVTDGRGRVVWSSSAANKAMDHSNTVERNAHTTLPSSRSAQTVVCPSSPSSTPPAPAGQLPEVSRVLSNDGFTTDGRGRVINIGSNDEEVFQPNFASATPPAPAPPRSFLGRMFDALF
jgi:hypothetical protein